MYARGCKFASVITGLQECQFPGLLSQLVYSAAALQAPTAQTECHPKPAAGPKPGEAGEQDAGGIQHEDEPAEAKPEGTCLATAAADRCGRFEMP